MPKSIKVKCFLLFFAVFTVIIKAEDGIDYVDCGSELGIENVYISNCAHTPCIFSPGDNFTVNVLTEANKLDLTDLVTEAYLRMFGMKWPLDITPENPCKSQWACPIHAENNLKYTADIRVIDDALRRPAHIEVLLKSDPTVGSFQALCIEFSVQIQ